MQKLEEHDINVHLVDATLPFDFYMETGHYFIKVQTKYKNQKKVYFCSRQGQALKYYPSDAFEFGLIHHRKDFNIKFALLSSQYLTENQYIGAKAVEQRLAYSTVKDGHGFDHTNDPSVTKLKNIIVENGSNGIATLAIQLLNVNLTLPANFVNQQLQVIPMIEEQLEECKDPKSPPKVKSTEVELEIKNKRITSRAPR
jgi:hypothetical protein